MPATQPRVTPRSGLLAVLALAPLAGALTACGAGPGGDKDKIAKVSTTYLRALADGDTATACAQLTSRARGQHCPQTLKARLARMNPNQLRDAADASLDIDVHGTAATSRLGEPRGARLRLIQAGANWRIDSGYTVGTPATLGARPAAATIPDTPLGKQLRWALAQLNGGAARLSAAEVRAHFSPEFLRVLMPARDFVALMRQGAERGPFTFTGFAFPPSATKAIALVDDKAGEKHSLRIELERGRPTRIFRFEIQEAPRVITASGPYNGRFDIGGRKVFLHCEGSGTPTVVFEGGLSSDWPQVQDPVARFTRACSYDPANAPWGRSDPAPTPRTAKDVVADLHALLRAAKVPGPYVLAGHSNGGLFVQLYAAKHPDEVAGLVLIDAVHPNYYARQIAVLKRLAPPRVVKQMVRQLETRQPPIADPEQIEPLDTSLAQTRAALAAHPLHRMPLFVLTRGHQPGSPPQLERLWRNLQDELAALVPHSRHMIATRSDHTIQDEQPALVVAAIRDVVQAVRQPASWRTR